MNPRHVNIQPGDVYWAPVGAAEPTSVFTPRPADIQARIDRYERTAIAARIRAEMGIAEASWEALKVEMNKLRQQMEALEDSNTRLEDLDTAIYELPESEWAAIPADAPLEWVARFVDGGR